MNKKIYAGRKINSFDNELYLKYKNIDKDLIETLNIHALITNHNNSEKLIKLSKILKNIKQYDIPNIIYRGFSPNSSFNNMLGLSEKGMFLNKVKPHKVGDKFKYNSSNEIISFTSNLDIAKDFGNTVVSIPFKNYKGNYIIFTPELVKICHELRNIKEIVTQDEIILLPPIDIEYTIVYKETNKYKNILGV